MTVTIPTEKNATRPQVSIVIPVRNEIAFIDRCLQSVFAALGHLDEVAEVLVVDGMSGDGTRARLCEWQQRHANLHVFDNPRAIVPAALNIGIWHARGTWIIRLDAHTEYAGDYLARCLATAKRTGADNVGGAVETRARRPGLQGRLVQALTTHRFGVGNSGFRTEAKAGPADTVPFGCYRREVFDRHGFFDERLTRNQDYEFNQRLRRAGGRIWFDPAIRATYYNQGTLAGLLRQAAVTGMWNPWTWYLAPYAFAWRHAAPLIFACALLLSFIAAMFAPATGQVALVAILAPYVLLALAASLQQARRFGIWLWPLLPPLFLAYHLAYGSGSIWGLVRLLLRRTPLQRAPKAVITTGSDPIQQAHVAERQQ